MEQDRINTWLNYYKEALHRVDEIVLFYNESGKLITWNMAASKELGYDGEELTKVTLRHIIGQESNALLLDTTEYQVTSKEVQVFRQDHTCFAGELKWLVLDDGEVYGICLIKNIQQSKEMRDQLSKSSVEIKEADGVKNTFLANVTHELRTPINGIKGLTTLLSMTELTKEQKENIQLMNQCVGNMERIVNELLDFSKVQMGKLVLEEREFEFEQWMKEILQLHQVAARSKGLTFQYISSSKIPNILIGDSYRLSQVLNNLLSNAIKFTHTGGVTLEVSVKQEIDGLVLHFIVSDTGIGFSEDAKENVFQSFSQVDPSITRRYGGTGLGLAICKGILEQMGGRIHVESREEVGTTFFVTVTLRNYIKEDKNKKENDITYETGAALTSQNRNQELESITNANATFYIKEDELSLSELMEKVMLCIELESWDKAEEYVHRLKLSAKQGKKEFSKEVFRLELALRKRNMEEVKRRLATLSSLVECV